jgi:transcriptional regulator GlxA family with amidase domain
MERRIQIVISALETDFRRAWDIVQIGRLVNLSGSRLRHLFKAEMDQTPAQFLKAIRMKEAATLLRTTFLSVKEIMNRVGISNESHFVHEFRKVYGLAPSKYRSATQSDLTKVKEEAASRLRQVATLTKE